MTVNYTTAVTQNERYRSLLDWSARDLGIVEAMKADELVTHVAATQQQLQVPVDGVLGPHTYAAVLMDRRSRRITDWNTAAPTQRIAIAGEVAVLNGRLAWLLDIQDGKKGMFPEASRAWIDSIIRTTAGVNWTWEQPYQGDGRYEWCTTYVAYCYATGCVVKLPLRTNFFSSTERLDHYARYEVAVGHENPKPTVGPYRMIVELDEHSQGKDAVFPDGTYPREGDIGLAGGVHSGPGTHGFLITGFDPSLGVAYTLEGNAFGKGPTGDIRQGVIRGTRRVGLARMASPTTYHMRRFIRLGLGDFVA